MRRSVLAYSIWGCAALVWLGVQIAGAAGIRINHTPSMPMGVWKIDPLMGPLQRGPIVSYCPLPCHGAARRRGLRRP